MPKKYQYDKIMTRSGEVLTRVSWSEYNKCEKIRNYVYRLAYERNLPIYELKLKAAKLFQVDEEYVDVALYQWKKWFYGQCSRHKPIEMFIEEDKERRKRIKLLQS